MTVQDDTLAAVDHQWETARSVWSKVDCWGFTSIRHALERLTKDGKVESKFMPSGVNVYRRQKVDSNG